MICSLYANRKDWPAFRHAAPDKAWRHRRGGLASPISDLALNIGETQGTFQSFPPEPLFLDFPAHGVQSFAVRLGAAPDTGSMTDGRTLELNLESTLDSVEASELIVQQLARRRGFSEQETEQFMIAIRETMANAVSHGNGYSREKSVYFEVVADSTQCKVTVRDQGLGFDPDQVPDPTAEDNLLRTSGRGLLLMRSFVDELSIRRADPAGTEVVLIKYSPKPKSHKEEDVSLVTNIREVEGVSIVDLSGRITLGEGSGQLRDTVRKLLEKRSKENRVEPGRRQLHRQRRIRGTRFQLHDRRQSGSESEAAEPAEEG